MKNINKNHIDKLSQYVPIVARVHGPHHPEFYEVAKIFDQIKVLANKADADLNPQFNNLREITNNYQVPSDVCESYQAVYELLSELDQAYSQVKTGKL